MMELQGAAAAVGLLDMWHWLTPKVISIGQFGDYVFFKFILDFLEERIDELTAGIFDRMVAVIAMAATAVLTLWVLIQGYRLVTGQLRESAAGLVINTMKATAIVAIAVSFNFFNEDLRTFFTTKLQNNIHEIVTGNTGSPADEIDKNLGWMQVAMTTLDMLDTAGDPGLSDEKGRNVMLVGLGSGGPAIVAGAMLLMYQVAIGLFIGFGPLFILCLLFDFTKSLFQRWLFYGIGTMFSMAVLSAMTSIALDMVTRVAAAMWTSSIAGNLILGENVVGGYNSQAMQQGGMGLILTTLIITIPPMAASFFQGTLGQFAAYATMGAHLSTSQPGQGSFGASPGSPGYGRAGYTPQQPSGGTGQQSSPGNLAGGSGNQTGGYGNQATAPTYAATGGGAGGGSGGQDQIKQGSQMSSRDMSSYAQTGTVLPSAEMPAILNSPASYMGGGGGGGGTGPDTRTASTPTPPAPQGGSSQAQPPGPPNKTTPS